MMSNDFKYSIKLAIDCIGATVERAIKRGSISGLERCHIGGQLHGIELVIVGTVFIEEKKELSVLVRKLDDIKAI